MYDALIIGGGAAGMSCALVLGSAQPKAYAADKRIGIIMHQKTSHLQSALFNNVLGLGPGTLGADILSQGKAQLHELYPHVDQIEKEKVKSVEAYDSGYVVTTNKNVYNSKLVVIAVGYTNLLTITGLEDYVEAHPRAVIEKDRIWLKNEDHLVAEGLYVAGTMAGWRSQFAIASGSGAQVATDILTVWNDGKHTKVHDKI
ncbi:FAD-dependent oxidoreductase [Psychroserpens sp.]|uniref:FAD-dependent oxidoreductase n=1 Tax=Psychroserpens sp. TaxID=2020870 RepID=UPI001B29FA20|nr:FAD-dependent oxidoreductase [Psychroserpens sp.]MBO6607749.1 NAD(P)/FAD-dependent oxidoreductase [Psychroserpens sp.]MBO6631149.1 NAD(P)/FAD-dependent oxidoreductase [Psychroserpens sp.]MBO6654740.1 NAD(P)/FAD-dependent oxidoreductase [Psychroserpens sp.]MBO6682836.1 NAD(P)/FAD-dependent oxidoreductase [Psychroserpens sp.]MBO6751107.1 NAD(P)/FAD-dependent oxidoreductase [Psychroserpens sp.]